MRSIWQLRVHNKDLLKVLMTNPFGQNAHRKVFQKASQFLLPLPNVQLSPQINVLHTSKIQCRLLNYLNFSSPTTTRCLSRRDFPTYHVNLYKSVPLVPGSSPWLSGGAHRCHLYKGTCSKWRGTHFEYSWVDHFSSLHRRSHPFSCAVWTEAGGWGRAADSSSHSGPFCLPLGFLNCDGWFIQVYPDFTHCVPLVFSRNPTQR